MERDMRRHAGQWRGCYSFKDIICDGDGGSTPRRDGGLKMGQTYYYYYELDGMSEAHDPSVPSTNTCPYLPGQTVNTFWVPEERSRRERSGSMNSVRTEDFKTMKPADRFLTPRPAPSPPLDCRVSRVGSSPRADEDRAARSVSPVSPGWRFIPRKFFGRKASSTSLRDACSPTAEDERGSGSFGGSRSRDMSPDSLRKFFTDEMLVGATERARPERPTITIPEEVSDDNDDNDDNDDDDNFATSAMSEDVPLTSLSPPPTQHTLPPPPPLAITPPARGRSGPEETTISGLNDWLSRQPRSRFSIDSSVCSPTSPTLPAFYHSEDEEEDSASTEDSFPSANAGTGTADAGSIARNINAALSTYSLPLAREDAKVSDETQPGLSMLDPSPGLVARAEGNVPIRTSSLLWSPMRNSGFGDLMSELGWTAQIANGGAI